LTGVVAFTAAALAGTAFADATGVFALLVAVLAVTFAAVTGFAGAADLAAVFLALLATGLLTGFLAAVATIDSSVGDTALEKLAADCATPVPSLAQVQIE